MERKTNQKPHVDPSSLKKNKNLSIQDKELLKQSIINFTESKTEVSDKDLDRYLQKIELLSGEVLDLNKLNVVAKDLQVYQPRFVKEYYTEIFRLNKWLIPTEGIIAQKPNIVGKWTKEIIYSRFDSRVLPTLELLNPYIRIGLRKHKHHQYLNEEGLTLLERYIEEAIQVMKISSYWYEFRAKLFERYGVPYQLEIYEEYKKETEVSSLF